MRSESGRTSEAYAGAVDANTPHGKPHKSSPAVKTTILGAKKVIKMKQVRIRREPSSVCFWPKRLTSQPLASTPKKAPTPEALPRPACHAAVNW